MSKDMLNCPICGKVPLTMTKEKNSVLFTCACGNKYHPTVMEMVTYIRSASKDVRNLANFAVLINDILKKCESTPLDTLMATVNILAMKVLTIMETAGVISMDGETIRYMGLGCVEIPGGGTDDTA